ncbi:cation:proton antiporter [Collinsella sp. An2]|uniref:cation:proton antiporter domain-containing protein n=1 Tax=Collinsella sp. An2 TaxID=1965585 RepID=UPI000B3AB162|nr:cation:proton antiporter [Collinsella sp. An2]OUP10369.1 sodium:proton exchanger [Collinsella sp. An2]
MHGDTILLMTFVFALVAAFVGGIVARALRLPPIVGYLVGGMVVSPFTPGFIGDSDAMNQLSEVGVMFMMFSTGLHFSLKDLFEVKGIAIPGAILQIVAGTLAGYALAMAFGWSAEAGIMLGLSVSIASTVVLIKNLTDAGLYQSHGGRVATGWLIVEDLATVVILVVLPVLFGPGEVSGPALAAGLAEALAKTVIFVALMLVVGSRVLPWLLTRIARFCPGELFQLAVVVIALGTAMAASLFFDLSVALGAFLAGVVVGGSKLSHRVAAEAIPFKDLFSIIFFASVGMMVNPATLAAHLPELVALVALIIVGKWLINMVLGTVLSAGLHTSLTVAAGLAQIGEFSFIIGQTGMSLGILSADQYSLILGGAVVSIALNSFVFKGIGPIEDWMRGHKRLSGLYERHVHHFEPPADNLGGHVVVVGYGHAGRCVTEVVKNLDIPCLVVERELQVAEEAETDGLSVLVGDAANSEILSHAHLDTARVLVIAGNGDGAAEQIAREARELAPNLRIVTRAETEDGVAALVAAGADDVVRPELEGGIELMRHTMLDLGYRPKQIQDYANDLRASGYEALGDGAQGKRMHAFERLVASLAEVDLHWISVGEGCPLAGCTLAQLDLRARTGANAVALRRGTDIELFLDAGTVLEAGDRVGMIGTAEALEAAEALLSA